MSAKQFNVLIHRKNNSSGINHWLESQGITNETIKEQLISKFLDELDYIHPPNELSEANKKAKKYQFIQNHFSQFTKFVLTHK